jgi:predicted nucleic acid-binding protein
VSVEGDPLPTRTYLDSSVLIAIIEAEPDIADKALRYVDDPDREIISSEAVRLEVYPRRLHDPEKSGQRQWLDKLFENAAQIVTDFSERVWKRALDEATTYHMQPMDALHVAAALEAEAEEFITAERPEKSLCRTKSIRVISLRSRPVRKLH